MSIARLIFSFGAIGLIVLALLAVVIVGVIVLICVLAKKKKNEAPTASIPAQTVCANCNTPLTDDAAFCPFCGAKRS